MAAHSNSETGFEGEVCVRRRAPAGWVAPLPGRNGQCPPRYCPARGSGGAGGISRTRGFKKRSRRRKDDVRRRTFRPFPAPKSASFYVGGQDFQNTLLTNFLL